MKYLYTMVADGTYCLTHYEGSDPEVKFPNHIKVTILGDKLFKNHQEIESIEIPDTVTEIGGWVFDGCVNLKSLTLPPNLKDLWQYALTRLSVESLEIPGTVHQIIPFTFNECKNLKKVVIHEGTKSIGGWAFKDCESLEDIYLPKSIETIHEKAFEGCPKVSLHRQS
jgi:hypothetical protein